MPPRPRTKAQHDARRQLILDQTRLLAREAGWHGVTIRAVAQRTRLSAPSLYELFPSKAALLAEVALAGFAELAQSLSNSDRHDDLGPLHRSATRYWRFAHDDPTLYDLMFHQPLELQFATGKTPTELHAGFAALKTAVTDAADQLGIALPDPETATEAWWAAMHGITSLALSRRVRRRPGHTEQLLSVAADAFSAGLRAGCFDEPMTTKGTRR
jgi:AcrR family transcriptional regulator